MKFRDVFILSLILGLSVFVGGFTKIGKQIKAKLMPPIEVVSISEVKGELRDFFLEDDHLEGLVNRWYDRLSLEAQVGQLIMPALDATLNDDALKLLIESETVGGFMVLTKDFSEASLKALEEANPNQVPLLVSVDAEPSLLKYRFTDPVYEKETADLKTAERITEVSRLIATELKRFGMNLNFAPVYDLSTNTTVIGTRAFSGTPAEVQPRANLMSQTFMSENVIPTAKHFPGHGLVAGDTHLESQTITDTLTELSQFTAAIKAQIPMIMVGHLAVTNENYDTKGEPATISSLMMQDLLRDEMGFEGVIITDAMNMQAVSSFEDADLKSLLAGADIALMPLDAAQLNRDIQTLLMAEPVFQAEIEAKIKRVLRLKLVWRLSQY
jgi:beta-N-acetylhexosaminidase